MVPPTVDQSSADEGPLDTPLASDLEIDPNSSGNLLQGSARVPSILENSVAGLSPRLKNCVVRLFASIIMIGGFLFLIYLGPLALVLLVRLSLWLFGFCECSLWLFIEKKTEYGYCVL